MTNDSDKMEHEKTDNLTEYERKEFSNYNYIETVK